MSIKIKTQEALKAKQSCEKLLKKSFCAKTAFKLLQFQKELSEIESNFNQIKDETVVKYSTKDEKNNPIYETLENGQTFLSVAPENRFICTKEISELLSQEVEVTEIFFNIEEFGENLITGEDLEGLLPFIKE